MDALIGFVAVMSMRYGLYSPEMVRRVCSFLRQYTLDELNAELQVGRSSVLVPTNRGPRFTDKELRLVNLRQICGDHIYLGFLLDVAAAVGTVNARICLQDNTPQGERQKDASLPILISNSCGTSSLLVVTSQFGKVRILALQCRFQQNGFMIRRTNRIDLFEQFVCSKQVTLETTSDRQDISLARLLIVHRQQSCMMQSF